VIVKSGSVVSKKKGGKEIRNDMYGKHQGTMEIYRFIINLLDALKAFMFHNVIITRVATVMEELRIRIYTHALGCNVE